MLTFKEKVAYKPLLNTIDKQETPLDQDLASIKKLLLEQGEAVGTEADLQVIDHTRNNKLRWEVVNSANGRRYEIREHNNQYRIYRSLHVMNQIVERDLCVRCGACEPACPEKIVFFDDQSFPYITDERKCPTACNRCLKVCPGEFVDFSGMDDEMFGGISPHPESITGLVRNALLSYSVDTAVREDGTSGGFVTQLLVHMLETGQIDGALVLGTTQENGEWQEKSYIVRSSAEIKAATKSKYMVTPYLRPLKEIEEQEGRYAIVALPCYVHAIRKYQRVSKKLRDRIVLVIGLFCNATFRPDMLDDIAALEGREKKELTNFYFRSGQWPGGLMAEFNGGKAQKLLKFEDMRDEFNFFKMLYTAPRCNMCIDYTAEYADITVGDPWLRDKNGRLMYEDSRSVVLIRTEAGEYAIGRAVHDNYLRTATLPLHEFMLNFERLARFKRSFVPKYIKSRTFRGLASPDYNREVASGSGKLINSFAFRLVMLRISQYSWMRKLILRFAQSRPGLRYLARNRRLKDIKFAKAYNDLEKFARRIASPLLNRSDKSGT